MFRSHFASFHTHASLLTFFVCFFILFHSCCSHARVFGKTLAHKFPLSYSHTEWYLLFSKGEIVLALAEYTYRLNKFQDIVGIKTCHINFKVPTLRLVCDTSIHEIIVFISRLVPLMIKENVDYILSTKSNNSKSKKYL